MANMELITSVTVGSGGAATVTLPGTGTIPQTYTDLKVVFSTRCTGSGDFRMLVYPNGSTSSLASQNLYGTGTGVSGVAYSGGEIGFGVTPNNTTGSTFGSGEIYFTDYASTTRYKSFSFDGASENNGSNAYSSISAGYWSNNSAITTLVLQPTSGNWMEGSTFYLYGISNVTSTPKAVGGVISQDASYWYHMFPFTSTFTPSTNLTSVDYLVVAGGGGGGSQTARDEGAGGGGAGGLRCTVDATGGGGSLESKISLNSGTSYTISVGAGGAGAPISGYGVVGSDGGASSIAGTGLTTISTVGGGGGAGADTGVANNGGSGGGAGAYGKTTQGSGTPNQGYAGGNTSASGHGGGGGGAGAVGTNGASSGTGGIGVAIPTIATPTMTGENSYYAGGGGGGGRNYDPEKFNAGKGGLGGGGQGGIGNIVQSGFNAMLNTGGGGGGGGANSDTRGGNGGSGIVVIRYAK